jgi:hypothetical protein
MESITNSRISVLSYFYVNSVLVLNCYKTVDLRHCYIRVTRTTLHLKHKATTRKSIQCTRNRRLREKEL